MTTPTGIYSPALRNQLRAAARYIEGTETQYLQRIDAAGLPLGDPVAFNPDFRSRDNEHTDAGTWVRADVLITTRTALVLNASYTWDNRTWVVGESGSHNVGSEQVLYHYSLTQVAE